MKLLTIAFILTVITACNRETPKPSRGSFAWLDPIIENRATDWANATTTRLGNDYIIHYLHSDTIFYTFELYVDTSRLGIIRPLDSATYWNFVYDLAADALKNTRNAGTSSVVSAGAVLQLWYVYFPDSPYDKKVVYSFYF